MQATALFPVVTDVSAETRTLVPGIPVSGAPSDTHALGESIAARAAGLHAAMYQLLVLLRDFDEQVGWGNGFLSCAHWLHSTPTRTVRASGDHRAVHEGGFRVAAGEGGALAFWRPDGERIDVVPSPVEHVVLPPAGIEPPPTWDGTRLDIAWAIDVLWRPARVGPDTTAQRSVSRKVVAMVLGTS